MKFTHRSKHHSHRRFIRRFIRRFSGLLAELALITPIMAVAQNPLTPHEPTPGGADMVDPGKPRDTDRMTHPPGGADASFVDAAGRAGMLEVQASQLALERSANTDVKNFARQMVADHTKAGNQLQQIAARKGIRVPAAAEVNPELQTLTAKQGHDFDVAYVAAAGPAAHEQAVRLFEREANAGQDPEIKAFARTTLPTLQQHLTMAQKLARSVANTK
ncbi:hypothetical protein PCA31118_00858 [Pandoraea captiosa]|uniref:DUF4142 domain-containing protein n=1 Tax=Pandoraea captiosa TaxID=2508302 RepID=A0A5E4ZM71_9BURK|nr:DUF4142 domain-containing protein [Pandoraea captiosa]VVE61978.1 hypothetical protein PCA31118_00858 [Pandoraea captiosa]